MKKIITQVTAILLFLGFFSYNYCQQQVVVEVFPTISRSIKGNKELDRSKYFNLAASPNEIRNHVDEARFEEYFKELGMSIGRKFQIIKGETNWGNGFKEDANRSGWMDTTYFKSKKNPTDEGMEALIEVLGSNAGLAAHDGHAAYPDFMEKYQLQDAGNDEFPLNNDAAAEMIAYYLKYNYTDFQRPATFELVNEPHWKYWSDPKFIEFHTKAKRKVEELGINVAIGGPCYSVGNFYKNEYSNLKHLTNFIESTNFELDFYSFHIYDYMRWDDDAEDFVGNISSGLPEEGVFDALAAYYFHQTGKDLSFVGSEHGGYLTDGENRTFALNKLANQYFPGTGFEHTMKKRSIDNFLMVNSTIANTLTFMNHPHIVRKAVPFILLESSGWDPEYYSSLLVKEDFNKNSSIWHEAKLIHFFDYFKGVQGRRVLSECNDADIQHFAFVNQNQLILLFHNQSNISGEITVDLPNFQENIDNIMIRRIGRGDDFVPFLKEQGIENLDSKITIGGQESIALFVDYPDKIEEEKNINEQIFYSPEIGVQFTDTKTFTVETPVNQADYAILRVGISRSADNSKDVEIWLNGTQLDTPVEDCADRITSDFYKTTKIIKVDGALLKKINSIEVKFPDGKSGGVGAVALRVGSSETIVSTRNFSKKKIEMFPNPTRHLLNISSLSGENIEIFDLRGKLLKSKKASSSLTSIDIQDLKAGLYIVRVNNGEEFRSGRFIVTF